MSAAAPRASIFIGLTEVAGFYGNRGGVPRGWTARLLRGSGHASIRVSARRSAVDRGSHAPRIGDAVPRPAGRRLASCCGGWPTPRPACCSWSGPSSGTTRSSSARGPASCSCRICDCCAGSGSGSCSSSPAAMRDRPTSMAPTWIQPWVAPSANAPRLRMRRSCRSQPSNAGPRPSSATRCTCTFERPTAGFEVLGRRSRCSPRSQSLPPATGATDPDPSFTHRIQPSGAQSWCARRSTVSWPRACSSSSSRSGTCPTGRCTRNCRRATS